MKEAGFALFLLLTVASCQSSPPSGNEVVFGDVIGKYNGECADYISSTSELMNREEATLTVYAANTNAAGINTSCERIPDQELPVTSASAAEIVFETSDASTTYTMIYIAKHDSITIIMEESGKEENLIFTGIRN